MNVKAISKNVGLALLVSSFFMLLSVGISLLYGMDSGFLPLLISFTITFIVGIFPLIFIREAQQINIKEGFVIIVLAWLLSFVFGMMPYVMWGGEISFADAWFESVSGFTTTGATILADIEALPPSLLFWRSSTHFIGGLGVVVFLLIIIPSASPFRQRLANIEVSPLSQEGSQIPRRKFVTVICVVYFSIFLVATLSLFLCGMPLFDAVNHGFSLCATGGFSTKNASIAAYDSPLINVVSMLIMIAATINFTIYYSCLARRSMKPFINDRKVRFYLASIVIMAMTVALSLRLFGGYENWGRALLDGVCTTVSYVTTTGFGFVDNSCWPFLAGIVLMYASIQCAISGSTSSGVKVDRMLVVFKSVSREIRTRLHPSSTYRIRLGSSYLPDEQVLPVILYIVLYFAIAGISMFGLLLCGMNGLEAVSGSIACLGNVGPGLGSIAAAGNYNDVPTVAKFIFTVDMFMGRIEIYPLLVTVSLLFKKDR